MDFFAFYALEILIPLYDINRIWQLVFNATNEKDSCERCKNILESHFSGININITKTQQNTLAIRIENEIFASWFKNNFGQYCDGKFVPDWIYW